MKEEIDTGSGYQDMGTNRILAVPVAEFAKSLSGFESDEVSDNIRIGDRALSSVTSASDIIGIGESALGSNTTANYNIAIGSESLKNNKSRIYCNRFTLITKQHRFRGKYLTWKYVNGLSK